MESTAALELVNPCAKVLGHCQVFRMCDLQVPRRSFYHPHRPPRSAVDFRIISGRGSISYSLLVCLDKLPPRKELWCLSTPEPGAVWRSDNSEILANFLQRVGNRPPRDHAFAVLHGFNTPIDDVSRYQWACSVMDEHPVDGRIECFKCGLNRMETSLPPRHDPKPRIQLSEPGGGIGGVLGRKRDHDRLNRRVLEEGAKCVPEERDSCESHEGLPLAPHPDSGSRPGHRHPEGELLRKARHPTVGLPWSSRP